MITEEVKTNNKMSTEEVKTPGIRRATLGNVRLRHVETNEIILIPTPTNDPNDPLTWYSSY
jgi:hypothetical protein